MQKRSDTDVPLVTLTATQDVHTVTPSPSIANALLLTLTCSGRTLLGLGDTSPPPILINRSETTGNL